MTDTMQDVFPGAETRTYDAGGPEYAVFVHHYQDSLPFGFMAPRSLDAEGIRAHAEELKAKLTSQLPACT